MSLSFGGCLNNLQRWTDSFTTFRMIDFSHWQTLVKIFSSTKTNYPWGKNHLRVKEKVNSTREIEREREREREF